MDKTTFLAVLEDLVAGFESADFKAKMGAAKASGDVNAMMAAPMGLQAAVMQKHGLDPQAGMAAFKAAGRQFALEPDAAGLLARMKAAL